MHKSLSVASPFSERSSPEGKREDREGGEASFGRDSRRASTAASASRRRASAASAACRRSIALVASPVGSNRNKVSNAAASERARPEGPAPRRPRSPETGVEGMRWMTSAVPVVGAGRGAISRNEPSMICETGDGGASGNLENLVSSVRAGANSRRSVRDRSRRRRGFANKGPGCKRRARRGKKHIAVGALLDPQLAGLDQLEGVSSGVRLRHSQSRGEPRRANSRAAADRGNNRFSIAHLRGPSSLSGLSVSGACDRITVLIRA